MDINQIQTIETYNYTPTGEIDYINKMTTIPVIDLGYLILKFGLGFFILFLAIRGFKNKK